MKLFRVVAKDAEDAAKADSRAGDGVMEAVQELERARAHLSAAADELYMACKRGGVGDLGEFPEVERKNIAKLISDKSANIANIQKTIAAAHKFLGAR